MSKVICERQDLVAIADEIRTQSGVTGGISLNGMKNRLTAANAETDTQSDMIAELASVLAETSTVLDGKAGGAAVETCTVKFGSGFVGNNTDFPFFYTRFDGQKIESAEHTNTTGEVVPDVVKNTIMFVMGGFSVIISGDGSRVTHFGYSNGQMIYAILVSGDCEIELSYDGM